MGKYMSKIDGKVFDTKEEMLNHLETTYILGESLIDTEYLKVKEKLKDAFPEADIHLDKNKNGIFYVEINFDSKYGNETFTFNINSKDHDNTGAKTFSDVDYAIDFYERYSKQTELIRETLKERFNLESFEVNQWVVADEWDNFGHHICLDVKLNGIEMYLESGIGQDMESFIKNQVDFYFKTEFEGELDSNYHGWKIGGDNLSKILNGVKKAKIIILERY